MLKWKKGVARKYIVHIAEDDVVVLRLFGDVYVFIQKDGLVFLEEISAAHTTYKHTHYRTHLFAV